MKICIKILAVIFVTTVLSIGTKVKAQLEGKEDCVSVYDSILQRRIYTYVDKMPKYPGGDSKMLEFFQKNFNYPKEQEVFQASIRLTFIIEEDGTPSNFTKQDHSNSLSMVDKEAIRVLKMMRKWTPGECNGKAVSVRMSFPVYF